MLGVIVSGSHVETAHLGLSGKTVCAARLLKRTEPTHGSPLGVRCSMIAPNRTTSAIPLNWGFSVRSGAHEKNRKRWSMPRSCVHLGITFRSYVTQEEHNRQHDEDDHEQLHAYKHQWPRRKSTNRPSSSVDGMPRANRRLYSVGLPPRLLGSPQPNSHTVPSRLSISILMDSSGCV